MPDNDLPIGGVKKRQPIEPKDLITTTSINPTNDLPVKEIGKSLMSNSSPLTQQPLSYTEGLGELNRMSDAPHIDGVPISQMQFANAQSGIEQVKNAGLQFLGNLTSGVGQSVANMFDLASAYKTAKGELTGSNDDFDSSFLGLSTKDMSNWAQGIAKNNPIYEKNPDSLDYTDPGKWANQIAQLGTSLGMAGGTLAATALIESATGGMGTAGVVAKLGQLGKNLFTGAKAAETIGEAYSIAKGLKGTAMIYGTLNRYSEARMEGQQTFQTIYEKLDKEKKTDGTPYSEAEKQHLASEGARKDFNLNELMTPLDILAFRMMVFNPISGTATGGIIEPLLEKVAGMYGKSAVGKAAGWGTEKLLGALPEGLEEQSQQYFQDEGEHKARVLAGLDDGTNFLQRFGKSMSTNDSINQGIGGFLGGLVLGPLMDGTGKIIQGDREGRKNAIYKHYLENVPSMDNVTMEKIKAFEKAGDFKSAEAGRKNFNIFRALSNKHIDEQNDKTTATDNHLSFLQDTLDQAKNDNFDNIKDMGYGDITPEIKQHILDNYQLYIDDAKTIGNIYDTVKDHYNRNFVPSITWDRFQLQAATKEQGEVNTRLNGIKNSMFKYNELSSLGKEQHDIGYQLNALHAEGNRLTKLYKNTENSQEKENVNKLLQENKSKQEQLNNRLEEIGKDNTYDPTVKAADNSLIKSSVHNQDYLQATYDQEHLANNIDLKRKKVALWNTAEYQQEQSKQAIKVAPNKESLETTKKDLEDKKQVTPEIKEAIKEKEIQLNAKEVADDLDGKVNIAKNIVSNSTEKQEQKPIVKEVKPTATINDDKLFDDGFNNIDSLIDSTLQPSKITINIDEKDDEFHQADKEAEMLLSPSTINTSKMPDEAKKALAEHTKTMLDQLPSDINFEDFIRTTVSKYGREKIDKLYNGLKEGWKLNGRKLTEDEANKVYSTVFADPIAAIEGIVDKYTIEEKEDEKEVAKDIDKEDEKLQEKELGEPVIDNTNQTVYIYDGKVTNNENPKLPIVIKNFDTTSTTNEDGTVNIEHDYTSSELREDENVNSLPLLDPDKYVVGDELELRVPTNVDNILVPIYNEDGTKGQAITWKQWKEEHPDAPPTSVEYQDKIPIIAYDKSSGLQSVSQSEGSKEKEKGLAFIHDVQWYHPRRFLQSEPEKMQNAIAKTREIRKAVLAKQIGESTNITITEKKTTSFAPFKTENRGTKINPDYEFIPMSEANPDAIFAVANGIDSFYEDTFKFDNNENVLLRQADLEDGLVYEIRRAGTNKEGKKTWNVFPLAPQPLSTEVRTTVIQALNVFLNRNTSNKAVQDKGKEIAKKIQEITGLDILRAGDLREYLNLFTQIHGDSNKAFGNVSNNKDVDAIANNKIRSKKDNNVPYIVIQNGGTIYLGATKQNIIPNTQTVYANSNAYSLNTISQFFANLNKKYITRTGKGQISILDGLRANYSIRAAKDNKAVAMIDATGNVTQTSFSYRDHAMKTFKTNIKSINVANDGEKPVYATTLQMISYDLSSKINPNADVITTKDVVIPIQEETKPIETNATQEDIAKQKAEEFLKQAQEDLGIDFNNVTDFDDLMSVASRTPEERKTFNEANNRVGDLNSEEDSQLNDFIFNQIGIVVNEKGTVSDKDIQETINKVVNDTLKPIRDYYAQKVIDGKELLKNFPELKNSPTPQSIIGYQKQVNKIDDLRDEKNLKLLFDKNKERLGAIGIKEVKLEQSDDNNDSQFGEQIFEDREGWQIESALSVDPNAKTSAALKRFYGEIPILDKDGKPKKGVFQLPLYYNYNEVGAIVKSLLADTVSDYDTMVKRLSEFKHPWINQLIDKLNKAPQQTRSQFVSDMSYNSLRMGYSMLQFNNKTKTWKSKNWDALKTGIADQIHKEWSNQFTTSNLILSETDDDGNLMLNKEWAILNVLNTYNTWLGDDVTNLESEFPYKNQLSTNKKLTIVADRNTPLGRELLTKLVTKSQRLKYSPNSSNTYQIKNIGEGKFEVSKFESKNPSKADISIWLSKFGINLSNGALDELMTKGLDHNYRHYTFDQLFQTGGLFNVLAHSLKYAVDTPDNYSYSENGKEPIKEGVVKSLAMLEYKYDTNKIATGVYIGGKSIYPITQEKFAVRRMLDLVAKDSETRKQLGDISFSKGSMWLDLLNNNEKFREMFAIEHLAPGNALQIMGKNNQKDNSLHNLSSLDYEMADFALFADMQQGDIADKYKGTNIGMRIATMLMPTMSDKTTPLKVRTAVLNLGNKELDAGRGINNEVKQVLYEQVVRPELQRMLSYWQNFHSTGQGTNVKGYDKGASLFMFIPKLNNLMYNDNFTLRDAIATKELSFRLNLENIEAQLKDKIFGVIGETINGKFDENGKLLEKGLKQEKLEGWQRDGIITRNETDNVDKVNWIDNSYFDTSNKFTGSLDEKVNMAILDKVVNDMIHLSNSFMMFAGDPALYYKSDAKSLEQQVKDSFVNVGKRLANQIAPGIKLANSENEHYIQVFLNDRKSIGDRNFIKNVTEILDGTTISDEEYDWIKDHLGKAKKELSVEDIKKFQGLQKKYSASSGYFQIEGSDAQEYTTWKEHLNILEKLGRTPDALSDITIQDIADARKLFSSKKNKEELTAKDKALITLVMQPIKPVYTGQIYDKQQDLMRTVYIKTSSFPLIPQLTEGFELDHVRKSLEKLEDHQKSIGQPMNVRASYQSGNKVGAMNNPIDLWDGDGRAKVDNLTTENLLASSLVLNRRDFKIQQDVPFKSGKNSEDKQTYGTQLMKLLFGNGIINFEDFTYQGRSNWTGRDLHKEYTKLHNDLVTTKQQQFFKELGLDNAGNIVDREKTIDGVQKLLLAEGGDRGFAKQVLDGLQFKGEGQSKEFTLPLWASISSDKFEALLNSIVSNRLAKIKFPGNAYVAGSPEGFKTLKENSLNTQSQVIHTSAWDGDSLKASYTADGKVKKVQVFVSSKFRDNDGNLINLLDEEWSTIGEDGVRRIRQDKFDEKLFSLTSFRIPTTGISSASQIEIAGFLPYTNADLMVLPSNLTKQKGLDFDVDKENTYQYHHFLNKDGRFEVLSDKHKEDYANSKNKELQKLYTELKEATSDRVKLKLQEDIKNLEASSKLMENVGGEEDQKLQEKLIQNKIIEIYESVLTNPNKQLQAKINTTLSTDYTESEAEFIESLNPNKVENWTALSSEYQKSKVALGASGKLGTGAYSMDVVFHSLAQQAAATGTPLKLLNNEGETISWRFGKKEDGGVETDGTLGNVNTQDKDRTTADLLNEVAQTAVDNEKLQIMGKVNANAITLDVHKVFNLLGLDKFKTENKHSIAYLFLSQPILREYVQQVSNSQSILSEFEADKKNKIIQSLYSEYGGLQEDHDYSDILSEEHLITGIKTASKKGPSQVQIAVLQRFLEMEKYGLTIRNIQTTLSVDSKGLGKSFFDVIQKRDKLDKIGSGTIIKEVGEISNVSNLVGEYKEVPSNTAKITEMKADGYYEMGKFMVKPNTYIGAINIATVATAYNTWHEFLPYDGAVLSSLFKEILPIIETQDSDNDRKTVENKQDILSEFKKYLATLHNAGFIAKGDDVNEERKRLYIDSDTNTSLPTYIQGLLNTRDNKIIDAFIKTNKLINSLEIVPNKNGQPSLMKLNNSGSEAWNEEYLYEALDNLMEVRGKNGVLTLPKIENKEYTLDTLAQDIINYSMLGNAKQEAIQFSKYISVNYMDMVGYSYMMRNFHKKLNGTADVDAINKFKSALGIRIKTDKTQHDLAEFSNQYLQHQPELIKHTVDAKEFNKKMVKVADNSYTYISTDRPTFIKVYDTAIKDKKKFRIFKFNGQTYNQVPVLGVFGMDEYQFNHRDAVSIVNGKLKKAENPEPIVKGSPSVDNDLYSINSTNSVKKVIEEIAKDVTNPYHELASKLAPEIGDSKFIISDTIQVNGKPHNQFYGGWNPSSRIITIHPQILNNPQLLAQTILHETTHELTYDKITLWIIKNNNGTVSIKEGSPKYAQDLVELFNHSISTVKKAELDDYIKRANNVTDEEKSKFYGFTNIDEFMTMALTDRGFQEILNKIEYRQSGKTLLDKFKEIVKGVLESLGAKFDANYTAAHAISAIFEVIKNTSHQEQIDNEYLKYLQDQADNEPIDDTQLSVMTSEFPSFEYNIPNTECV